jgi:hypothetical protein
LSSKQALRQKSVDLDPFHHPIWLEADEQGF